MLQSNRLPPIAAAGPVEGRDRSMATLTEAQQTPEKGAAPEEIPAHWNPHAPTTRPRGWKSPTVTSMQLAGWSMLACFFLPLCRNCSGTVVRPVDAVTEAVGSNMTVSELLHTVTLLGAYGNGVLIATLITASACLASRTFWWRAFVIQYAASVTLGTVIACLIVGSSQQSASDRLSNVLMFIPPVVAGALWVRVAMHRGQLETAWSRLQHTWTMVAFFYLHLLCVFSQGVLFGYWLTLLALAGMLISVEVARLRMRHDLWNRSEPVCKPQFSLRTVFLWMTLVPLVVFYYRAIEPFANWLFKQP